MKYCTLNQHLKLSCLFALLFFAINTHAQIDKGRYTLDGNFYYTKTFLETSGQASLNFRVGNFLKQGFLYGVGLESYFTGRDIVLGPSIFARQYLLPSKPMIEKPIRPFLEEEVAVIVNYGDKFYSIALSPGFNLFFNNHISLDLRISIRHIRDFSGFFYPITTFSPQFGINCFFGKTEADLPPLIEIRKPGGKKVKE